MVRDVSLSCKGMARVSRWCVDKNFCFVVNGEEYWCSLAEAVFVSPGVEKLLEVDPTSRRMVINVDGLGETFDFILDLMRGKVVGELNREETFNIVKVGRALDNQELVMNVIHKFLCGCDKEFVEELCV